jgi:hypothetical protein
MLYRDLVEDGHISGLLVHPDWWEPKHPQENPVRVDDPVALWRPAPELSKPPGEGDDPRTGCCNLDPGYTPNTTTSGAVEQGQTVIGLNDALRFDEPQGAASFVYIQMDNNDWYCSPIAVPVQCTPTYSITLAYPFDGPSPISDGANVIAGTSSTFVLAAAAVPASLDYAGSADGETSAIQINATGGCPPYLYTWEWVTQPDPLVTITSPTSDNSTLTIGSLADGTYEGELLVTVTDTASTPQEVEVRIPVTLSLAAIAQIILGAPDVAGGQTLLTSDDDLTTLVNESLDAPSGDDWDNILIGSAGNQILTQSNESEGWYSDDNGATWEEITAHTNTSLSFGSGGGNNMHSYDVTYGVGAPFDILALVRADDVSAIVDGVSNKTISTSGASPPVYDGVTTTDFGSGSISLQGSSTSYLRAYNASDGDYSDREWSLEFNYKPSANDLAVDAATERVILHSDKAWGTAGSWYIYCQASLSDSLTYGIVFHNGATFDSVALSTSTFNRLDSPNGWQHIIVSRWRDDEGLAADRTFITIRHGALGTQEGVSELQLDSNFRVGGDGSGSTAGRNDTALGYADGNIDEIRSTHGFARSAYQGTGIGTSVQDLYQKTRWPTTGESLFVHNRTDPAGRGTFVIIQADPRLHQHGIYTLVGSNDLNKRYWYGLAKHKGEFFYWSGSVDLQAAEINRPMTINKWNPATRLAPWLVSDYTQVLDLTTVVPAGWGGSYTYTFSGQNGQFGGATWIASDGTNLYAAIYNTLAKDCAIVVSTDDGSTWNTNSNEISYTSTLFDWPRQLIVDGDGYGYFITFGGVWRSNGALTSNPTWTYNDIRNGQLSGRGNVKRGEIINGKVYIVGQADFSPAQGMVGVSTDKGATFTINTNTEFAALTGVTDLYTLGQNP